MKLVNADAMAKRFRDCATGNDMTAVIWRLAAKMLEEAEPVVPVKWCYGNCKECNVKPECCHNYKEDGYGLLEDKAGFRKY